MKDFGFIASLGKRAEPLLPELREIVEGERLHRVEIRIHAAYVLAKLEPQENRWRSFLQRYADFPLDRSGAASIAQQRLAELSRALSR